MPDGPGRRQGRPRWRTVLRSLDTTLGPPGHPRPAFGPAGVPSMNREARPRKRLPRARGQTAPGPSVHANPGLRAKSHAGELRRARSDADVQPRRRRVAGPRSRSCLAFAAPPPLPSTVRRVPRRAMRAFSDARPSFTRRAEQPGRRRVRAPRQPARGQGTGSRRSANAVPVRGCLEAGRVVWHPHAGDCGDGRQSAKNTARCKRSLFPVGAADRPAPASRSSRLVATCHAPSMRPRSPDFNPK